MTKSNFQMEANQKNLTANMTAADNGVQPLSKVGDLQKQVEEVKTVGVLAIFCLVDCQVRSGNVR